MLFRSRAVHDLGRAGVHAGVDRARDDVRRPVGLRGAQQVDRPGLGVEQQSGLGGGVGGDREHPGEVVAATGRDDGEHAAAPGDGPRDRGQHAVAADRHDDGVAVDGSVDERGRLGGRGRVGYLDLGTGLAISGTTLNANVVTNYLASKTLARFTPRENQPPASAFATLDTRNSIAVLDFDAATDEAAIFSGVIPDYANLSSGLKVRLTWMATTATSGNCRWGVQFERANTDLDSDSFDTATEAHSAANATSGIPSTTEITCTAIDSLAVGDTFRIKVFRNADDATNDTMTGDAELIAIEVQQVA